MTTMIERLGKILHQAIDEAPYMVRSNSQWYRVTDGNSVVFVTHDPEACEDECDKLNDQWIARKVVEALKGDVPYYETDKMWKELTSTDVWNLALDKILNETGP